jgi:thymidine phosphorylase
VDLAAGIALHARTGDRLSAGQPLLTLELGGREVDADELRARAAAAFVIADQAPPAVPLVAARLGGSA